MSFNIVSAILRGKWLLNPQYATSQFPLVKSIIEGRPVDFGSIRTKPEASEEKDTSPKLIVAGLGTSAVAKFGVYSASPGSDINKLPGNSIVVVSLTGPMIKRGDMCSYGMVDNAALINDLANSPACAGIIIDMDSPGGQADGTAMLASAIKEASAKKPVLGFIDDGMAASAGMWIISSTSEIYVSQLTDQVGSIGVYTTIADWAKFYESQGLSIREIYAPQSTDKNKSYYDALEGNDTLIKEDLSVLAGQFINTISENRAGKIKGDDWKTGKMYYAKDAIKIGLIDGVKSFNQVLSRMASLISSTQKSNSNTMAFEKTLATAKAESFAVTDEGFVVSEEQMNNIEAGFDIAETTAGSLATAMTDITVKDARILELENENAAAATLATNQATKITELEGTVATLGKGASGSGTTLTVDAKTEVDKEVVSEKPKYDSAEHPANKFAEAHKGYDSGIPAKK